MRSYEYFSYVTKLFFGLMGLFFSYNTYACIHFEDLERKRDLQKLIKLNFDRQGNCITPSNRFNEVNDKFAKLMDYYDYDDDLKDCYARFLFSQKKILEGLLLYSEMIISAKEMSHQQIRIFFNNMDSIKIQEYRLKDHIDKLHKYILSPRTFANYNHLITNNSLQTHSYVKNFFVDETIFLFNLLKKLPFKNYYEAMLSIILDTLDSFGHHAIATKLIHRLYTQDGSQSYVFVKLKYALMCLFPEKKYAEAKEIYTSILELDLDSNNLYRTSFNYKFLGILYCFVHDFHNAKRALENAICIKCDPSIFIDLAYVHINLKEFSEAIESLNKIKSLPSEVMEDYHIKIKKFHKFYETCLQLAGRTEDLTKLLLKRQKKALENQRNRGYHIKEMMTMTLQNQINEQQQSEIVRVSRINKEQQKRSESQPIVSAQDFSNFGWESNEINKSKVSVTGKTKVKTRKITPLPIPCRNSKPTMHENQYPVTIEVLLGKQSNPYKIFCKFFEIYDQKIKDKQIKISLKQVEILMKALNQDFDRKKGKGSHTKLTMNFKEINLNHELKEEMVILSHKTYLIAEQIKDLRGIFLEHHLYPIHLKEILQKDISLNLINSHEFL